MKNSSKSNIAGFVLLPFYLTWKIFTNLGDLLVGGVASIIMLFGCLLMLLVGGFLLLMAVAGPYLYLMQYFHPDPSLQHLGFWETLASTLGCAAVGYGFVWLAKELLSSGLKYEG